MSEQGGFGDAGSYSLLNHQTMSATACPRAISAIFPNDGADLRSDGLEDGVTGSRRRGGSCCYFNYSRPVMVLDVLFNMAFVVVSVMVLLSSFKETPSTPLRIWVSGYAFYCFLHVGFVCFDHGTRRMRQGKNFHDVDDDEDDYDDHGRVDVGGLSACEIHNRMMKRLESINTMVSSIWWVIGFYWIVVGGPALLQDSPRLYWLTVVFLAFDVFFVIFCIIVAFIVFLAAFCIPIAAVVYAFAIGKGASEDDIRSLPKYKYRQGSQFRTMEYDKKREVLGTRGWCSNTSSISEIDLPLEDSKCCICLSRYVDGVELYTLPCNHHFHCRCISKWLRMNATCPLCKINIRRGDNLV
ncbi:hypothetical protein K2173_015000 [Erythroxylum novogranatense]|uniref:RING-type E3 ubiquitin transferase n=1 Tax=Erythroxylum novogranatense TaxID=1862640 RepID=A0AAV8TV89_9ROSI|nr:hypothetical protein K2173_015000 [Erythroxylum novogranatense]